MSTATPSLGDFLRKWRGQRRFSQLSLALEADISQRHLSFIESGRARPSRDMVLRLADHLQVPLREQNAMLISAGFAPAYRDLPYNSADMARTRKLIDALLTGMEPNPALAIDRGWNILASNRAVTPLLEGVAADLLQSPVNALRLTLHPGGLASRIVNFHEWRDHVLKRLAHDIALSSDARLMELLNELRGYPASSGRPGGDRSNPPEIAVPLILNTRNGQLSLLSTTTVFGTAVDITLADIMIETFVPADDQTADILKTIDLA